MDEDVKDYILNGIKNFKRHIDEEELEEDLDVSDTDSDDLEFDNSESIDYDQVLSSTLAKVDFDVFETTLERHKVLAKLLGMDAEDELYHVFTMACVLCDKMTKPCNNDEFNISLDLTTNLLTLLTYQPKNEPTEYFKKAKQYATIVERILNFLKVGNSRQTTTQRCIYFRRKSSLLFRLRGIAGHTIKSKASQVLNEDFLTSEQDSLGLDFSNGIRLAIETLAAQHPEQMPEILKEYRHVVQQSMIYRYLYYSDWVPFHIGKINSDVLYSVMVVAIYGMYKLYQPHTNDNLCLNPFLGFFIKTWMELTEIYKLTLKIALLDEDICGGGSPLLVKLLLQGIAPVRLVLAAILNQECSQREHDYLHESLNNFMTPYGRKCGDGSLRILPEFYILVLEVIGDKSDYSFFLDADIHTDQLDETLLTHYDHKLDDVEDVSRDYYVRKEYTVPCYCEYDDQDSEEEDEDDEDEMYEEAEEEVEDLEGEEEGEGKCRCSTHSKEHLGDLEEHKVKPHDSPMKTVDDKLGLYLSWDKLHALLKLASTMKLQNGLQKQVFKTVSRLVMTEYLRTKNAAEELPRPVLNFEGVTVKKLRDIIGEFLGMWYFHNSTLASGIVELCLRTNCIRLHVLWLLGNVRVHTPEIYSSIHDLITNVPMIDTYGAVALPKVVLDQEERHMLLHTFFNSCSNRYNDEEADFELTKKLVILFCVVLKSMASMEDLIILSNPEFKPEVQSILLPWIGIVPAARPLYFETQSVNFDNEFSKTEDQSSEKKLTYFQKLLEQKYSSLKGQTEMIL